MEEAFNGAVEKKCLWRSFTTGLQKYKKAFVLHVSPDELKSIYCTYTWQKQISILKTDFVQYGTSKINITKTENRDRSEKSFETSQTVTLPFKLVSEISRMQVLLCIFILCQYT